MIANLLAANLPPAKFIRFLKRPAHHHHALTSDLHLPTPARDDVPICSASNLTRQHPAIFEQQDAGFTIANCGSGARSFIIRAHSPTRHRKKKYERDKPRRSAMSAAHRGEQ
jgi:hypothetical protein